MAIVEGRVEQEAAKVRGQSFKSQTIKRWWEVPENSKIIHDKILGNWEVKISSQRLKVEILGWKQDNL